MGGSSCTTGPITGRTPLPRELLLRAQNATSENRDLRADELGDIYVCTTCGEMREGQLSGACPVCGTVPEAHKAFRAIEAMGVVTQNLKAKTISHICYGDFAAIYPKVLKLPVDQLDLAMHNYGYRWLELFDKNPFTKELAIGIVDVHTHETETVAVAAEGIRKGLRYVSKERLLPHPDCGLKTRGWPEVELALTNMVAAAHSIRSQGA